MERSWRILLGVVTFVPFLSILLVLAYFLRYPAVFDALTAVGDISPRLVVGPTWGLWAAGVGVVIGVLDVLFYLVWTARTPKFTVAQKAAWATAVILLGWVAMPMLWWLHVRSDSPR